ncbi:MAG: family 20 glycosylhydrolase [Phycisphaerales bacterium]|nr:family 20 glycosylhydrolase [Phycisphaerales bacterium]
MTAPLPLIPTPRRMRLTGGPVALRDDALALHLTGCEMIDVREARDAARWSLVDSPREADVVVRVTEAGIDPRSIRGQSYRLEIGRPGNGRRSFARIEAPGVSGARYGLATLRQVVRCARLGWTVREMVIEDEPSFGIRGVMLDLSRDRVPTMEMLREFVQQLAALKVNHLQLYMEHTFAYAGHEEVWRDASPVTAAQLQSISALCAACGIELAANQNCFGHLTRWLELPRYAHLAETHGEWVFDNGQVRVPRSGPFSLCPTDPASLALVDDLLGQLLPCVRCPRVNIGCDETFDVGTGRSRDAVTQRGRAAIYAEYVNAVAAIARRHLAPHVDAPVQPMFWADIALREPAALDLLDDDLVALVWGYEPDAAFDRWCRAIRESKHGDRAIWMCPGTSAWRSITGRTAERRGNLIAAARAGLTHGATGFLITEWGDHGHRQQWPIALNALADGAAVAWNADAAEAFDARAASVHLMDDAMGQLGPWIDALGDLDAPLRDGSHAPRILNASAMFVDLHESLSVEPHFGGSVEAWQAASARWRELGESMPRIEDEQIRAELEHTLAVCRLAIDRALLRRGAAASAVDLARQVRDVVDEHRRLWLARSREGGLADSCRYYERIAEELERLD